MIVELLSLNADREYVGQFLFLLWMVVYAGEKGKNNS